MVSLIVLPPLHNVSLTSHTAVTVFHAGNRFASLLSEALTQFPKAAIALHPADAPLHAVSLPPLPAQRRDAALRVKLEDMLLSDTAHITLAVQTVAKHQFAVSCVSSALLANINTVLSELHHSGRTVVALSAQLPPGSEHRLGDWTLWRDDQGAGALPATDDSTATPLMASYLSANSVAFTATQSKGAAWQRWRWAVLLAVLCGLIYLAGAWWQSRQLLALELQTNRAIAAAFQTALPNTPMVDPVLQLQRAAKGGNALTTALGNLPPDWPQGMVTQLSWANARLSVTARPAPLQLNDAQQKTLTETLAAKNIALTWSKP